MDRGTRRQLELLVEITYHREESVANKTNERGPGQQTNRVFSTKPPLPSPLTLNAP